MCSFKLGEKELDSCVDQPNDETSEQAVGWIREFAHSALKEGYPRIAECILWHRLPTHSSMECKLP